MSYRSAHASLRIDPSIVRDFLGPLEGLFTTRPDGSKWARWRQTLAAAEGYLAALLTPGRRKNMEALASRVGIPTDRLERFVRESPWEHEPLQRHLVSHIPESIRSDDAVLVIDDVALVKQGRYSVAVWRQYAGAVGKVANSQVAVDLIYVAPGGKRNADQKTWPLGMELYVPAVWLEDPAFEYPRDRANLPKNLSFRTKPEIALAMVDRARERGIKHTAIVSDAGYGDSGEFRGALRERGERYIVGVNPSQLRVIDATVPLVAPGGDPKGGRPRDFWTYPKAVEALTPRSIAKHVKKWTKVTWSQGTKGKLRGKFFCKAVRVVSGSKERRHATNEVGVLLLEQRKDELVAYMCWGADEAPIEQLVAWAHARWAVEQFHREAKQELGLDRFEGRTWRGWHHHASMVLLAYAFVSLQRAERRAATPLPTFPAVVRLIVLESATQRFMTTMKMSRRKAAAVAEDMLRGYTDWG